jgi:hypothetical protein
MRRITPQVFVLFAALLAPLFFAPACANYHPTPQAATFDTLKAAAVGIDAYRATVEQARTQGAVSEAQWQEFAARYNKANDAIILATKVLRDVGGLNAETPAEVDAAIASLVELVTTIVPPKGKAIK